MAEDFARAVGSPRTIEIDGKEYLVSKFGPRDIGDLQAWLKDQIPDPRLEAKKLIDGVSDAVAIEIWKTMSEEAKSWPPTIFSDEGINLIMSSTEGVARLLWVTLRRENRIDLARARDLVDDVGLDQIGKLIELASPETEAPKL